MARAKPITLAGQMLEVHARWNMLLAKFAFSFGLNDTGFQLLRRAGTARLQWRRLERG